MEGSVKVNPAFTPPSFSAPPPPQPPSRLPPLLSELLQLQVKFELETGQQPRGKALMELVCRLSGIAAALRARKGRKVVDPACDTLSSSSVLLADFQVLFSSIGVFSSP